MVALLGESMSTPERFEHDAGGQGTVVEPDRSGRPADQHGRSEIEYDTIGSVAERFLMTLPCDVLAIPTRK